METLTIELSKTASGDSVLRCVRADGSASWQRNAGPRARFFAMHDLTHYAVESMLETDEGFYGLIARGWDIEETTGKGAKGALPEAAIAVEHLVGLLDAERSSGTTIPAAEVNAYSAAFARESGRAGLPELSEELLRRIRAEATQWQTAWNNLSPGETMTLSFSCRETTEQAHRR